MSLVTHLEIHITGKTYPVLLRVDGEVAKGYIERFINKDTGIIIEDGYFIPLENITFMKVQNDPS